MTDYTQADIAERLDALGRFWARQLVVDLEAGDTAWNPGGDPVVGPARVTWSEPEEGVTEVAWVYG